MNGGPTLPSSCGVKAAAEAAKNHVAITVSMVVLSILTGKIKIRGPEISFLIKNPSFLIRTSFLLTPLILIDIRTIKLTRIVSPHISMEIKLKVKKIHPQTLDSCPLIHNGFK